MPAWRRTDSHPHGLAAMKAKPGKCDGCFQRALQGRSIPVSFLFALRAGPVREATPVPASLELVKMLHLRTQLTLCDEV